jgi:hypothetical protein
MIVNIRDPQTLRQINPISISTYLQQNGWHEQQHIEGGAGFWTKIIEDNEQVEISIPLNPNFADFHFRISEILQNLAITEHRLPEEIFDDLVNVAAQKEETSIHVSAKEIESTVENHQNPISENISTWVSAILIMTGCLMISRGSRIELSVVLMAVSIISLLKNLKNIKIEISLPKITIK